MRDEQPTWKWLLGYTAIMLAMALAFVYFNGVTSLVVMIGGVMAFFLAFVGLNTLCTRLDGKTVVAMLLGNCMILALSDVGEEVGTRIFNWSLGVLVVIGGWSSARLLWPGKTKAERWDAAMQRAGWDVKALRARWGSDAERMVAAERAKLDN